MAINREFSQFANFVEVDDNNRTIGIATTATPYIGFGTTNPSTKVEVVGGLTADNFYGVGNVVGVKSEGTYIGAGVSTFDFRTTTGTGVETVEINSGIASVTIRPGISIGLAIALGS